MIVKNGAMVATVWAESIPHWSTSTNVAVLSLDRDEQVWLLLMMTTTTTMMMVMKMMMTMMTTTMSLSFLSLAKVV